LFSQIVFNLCITFPFLYSNHTIQRDIKLNNQDKQKMKQLQKELLNAQKKV